MSDDNFKVPEIQATYYLYLYQALLWVCTMMNQEANICWQERITNKEVLKMAGIGNLSENMRRRRWKFIGHIMRKEPNNDCRTALPWAPEGWRKQGRPCTTWRRTAEREMEKAGWRNWSKVQIAAADRDGWRNCFEALYATWHEEDR